jgi:hypothetical protein
MATDWLIWGFALAAAIVAWRLFGDRVVRLLKGAIAEDIETHKNYQRQLFTREGPYYMAVEQMEAEVEPVEDLPHGGFLWRDEIFGDRKSAEEVRRRHVLEAARAFYEERDLDVRERLLAQQRMRQRFGRRGP